MAANPSKPHTITPMTPISPSSTSRPSYSSSAAAPSLLEFLDRLARFLLEDQNGQPRGYILQTLLEFVGTPTIFSAADALGILRGYLNWREGSFLKALIMVITAILPFIPTGPAHYIIDKLFPSPAQSRSLRSRD